MKIAIFDYDGTLFTEETIPFLLKEFYKSGYSKTKLSKVYLKLILLMAKYKLGVDKTFDKEMFRRRAAEIFLTLLDGYTRGEVEEYFKHVSESVRNKLNPKLVDEVKKRRAEGVHTLILSGCYLPLIKLVGEIVGVDEVIGTEVYYDDNQTIDIKRKLRLVTGDNKVKALKERFDFTAIDWKESYAYADSYYDIDCLSLVGNPVAVKPDGKLKQHADENKWRIIQ